MRLREVERDFAGDAFVATPDKPADWGRERLRIGIVAPPWFAVPPPGYGGIERVVAYLANGLVEHGHDVTLIAAEGSNTKARLLALRGPCPELINDDPTETAHIELAESVAGQLDVLHDHTRLGLQLLPRTGLPLVHTVHGAIGPAEFARYADAGGHAHLVAISERQRSDLPLNVASSVIYNAIDLATTQFGPASGDYLLFVGRVSPDKGIVQAIEIARRAGYPLKLVVKINEPEEHEYYESVVHPLLKRSSFELLVQPPEDVKQAAYAGARALLFPIQWEEPFGLVMIEAMAAGTPVVAFRRGSVPEVIRDGETGYIVGTVDQAVEAVHRIPLIDRRACRQWVERRFSVDAAITRHERLYQRVVRGIMSPLGQECETMVHAMTGEWAG